MNFIVCLGVDGFIVLFDCLPIHYIYSLSSFLLNCLDLDFELYTFEIGFHSCICLIAISCKFLSSLFPSLNRQLRNPGIELKEPELEDLYPIEVEPMEQLPLGELFAIETFRIIILPIRLHFLCVSEVGEMARLFVR